MQSGSHTQLREKAAAEFNDRQKRSDGARIVDELCAGLRTVRELFFLRIHADVEAELGLDSMIAPISPAKSEAAAKLEIDIYQVATSAVYAKHYGYVTGDNLWYLNWLAQLRLGEEVDRPEIRRRLDFYADQPLGEQRHNFSIVLESTFREACRAPLIVYRLLPLAVAVVTSVAFQNPPDAREARQRQIRLQPAITDCRRCNGRVLENGEQCGDCGNPFWKFAWLTAAD